MDDFPIHKIQISGATLASLLHRSASSSGDIHGLLYGGATYSTPSSLSDDPILLPSSSSSSAAATTPHLIATITSFLSLPSNLPLPLSPPPPSPPSSSLLGSFSARRRTPSRPSLKDSATSLSLSSDAALSFKPLNATRDVSLPPCLFLLLTTPLQDQIIHTHEYKVFQYSGLSGGFEARSLDVVNIGPSFRGNYEGFAPISKFPFMEFRMRGVNDMVEDVCGGSLKDQKVLDGCAEGFEIGKLSRLMGAEASGYSGELEELYDKMLAKLHGLARLVEKSDTEVLEQENHNMKLRRKIAGLE